MRAKPMIMDVDVRVEGDEYVASGSFECRWTMTEQDAPHDAHREVEQIGQALKREVYRAALEEADRRITFNWQLANTSYQKRGHREYPIVTRFGTVRIQRQRLCDGHSWCVPSAALWETPQQKFILPAVREAAVDQMRKISARASQKELIEEAGEKILGVSTIIKIVHEEGKRLTEANQQTSLEVLQNHPQVIENGLVRLTGDQRAACWKKKLMEKENKASLECSDEEDEVVRQRAVGFLEADLPDTNAKALDCEGESNEPQGNEGEKLLRARTPRVVDEGWVIVQPDEVKTKAQATESGKQNWTYMATVQTEKTTYYFAENTSAGLWIQVAAQLCRLGVVSGEKLLLVIGDGAEWIRDWFEGLKLRVKEMVLCWYHLAKRVYDRLSGGGFPKERRKAIEHEVLGHLWHGDVSKAVWVLWGVRSEARNPKWIRLLMGYLLLRRNYLPDYSLRHEAGLWIASTRVEKWNDWAISNRCKRRGMSWTAHGVLALACHEAAMRNGELEAWRNQPSQSA